MILERNVFNFENLRNVSTGPPAGQSTDLASSEARRDRYFFPKLQKGTEKCHAGAVIRQRGEHAKGANDYRKSGRPVGRDRFAGRQV